MNYIGQRAAYERVRVCPLFGTVKFGMSIRCSNVQCKVGRLKDRLQQVVVLELGMHWAVERNELKSRETVLMKMSGCLSILSDAALKFCLIFYLPY
jgi:hypothetical protein